MKGEYMNQNMSLDQQKLTSIAHSSHTAEVVMVSLGVRERMRPTSDLGRIKKILLRSGERIVDSDYTKLWKDLEAAGVGSIVYGRNGNPDRFHWHYSLKKVAKTALEGPQEEDIFPIDQPPKEENKAPVEDSKPVKRKRGRPKKKHESVTTTMEKIVFIPLRKGVEINIQVPADLTKEDVRLISNALFRIVNT
jgi:hypothetical protein